MRHKQKTKNLSRFSSHYKATIRSLSREVLIHQRIVTTRLRAKLAKRAVDKLVSLGKDTNSLASRREAFSFLNSHALVKRLFLEVAPMFSERNGGYTRIIPYKRRRGDNAELVILELSTFKTTPKPIKEKLSAKKAVEEQPKAPPKPEAAEPKPEHKDVAPPEKTRHKKDVQKPPKKKGLGGFRKFFKKERDSL